MPPELWSIWTGMRGQCCTPVGCTSSTPRTGQGQYQLAGSGEILLCTVKQLYRDPQDDIRGILLYVHIFVNRVIAKPQDRIKGLLLYVCTWTSTIKHAYSKAPGQGILLSTKLQIQEQLNTITVKPPGTKDFWLIKTLFVLFMFQE